MLEGRSTDYCKKKKKKKNWANHCKRRENFSKSLKIQIFDFLRSTDAGFDVASQTGNAKRTLIGKNEHMEK